jgi:hypothetical protein
MTRRKTTDLSLVSEAKQLTAVQLNDLQIALARFEGNLVLAQQEFQLMHSKVRISTETCAAVLAKYRTVIEQKKLQLSELNPLLNRSFRDQMAWLIFRNAAEVRPRQWRKDATGALQAIETDDTQTMLEVLKLLARNDIDEATIKVDDSAFPAARKMIDGSGNTYWQTDMKSGVKFKKSDYA